MQPFLLSHHILSIYSIRRAVFPFFSTSTNLSTGPVLYANNPSIYDLTRNTIENARGAQQIYDWWFISRLNLLWGG